jgi:hypothetical protein
MAAFGPPQLAILGVRDAARLEIGNERIDQAAELGRNDDSQPD